MKHHGLALRIGLVSTGLILTVTALLLALGMSQTYLKHQKTLFTSSIAHLQHFEPRSPYFCRVIRVICVVYYIMGDCLLPVD